jgi:hypothetical protein
MNLRASVLIAGGLVGGAWLGGLSLSEGTMQTAAIRADEAAPDREATLTQLRGELEKLKASSTLDAAMRDVDYHAQNLWFAGRAGNWPLAKYYWNATRSHIRLAWDAKQRDGEKPPIDFAAIQQAIENSPSMQVGKAIDSRDVVQFQTHYRGLLEGCYACHKAAGMPFLRPRMPVKPHQGMINVDPNATWPQ